MKTRHVLALLGLVITALDAAEPRGIALRGIEIPFADASGKLTHKLVAQRGSIVDGQEKLEDAEIVFFNDGPAPREVQRVRVADAIIDRKANTLTGTGKITVETEESALQGEGFNFSLTTARLDIHRAFRLSNSEVVMTSDRATADLAIERRGARTKVQDLTRCEAQGNLRLVFSAAGRKKTGCDEAFSENAIYDGTTREITLPQPVRALRDGVESRVGSAIYQLTPK